MIDNSPPKHDIQVIFTFTNRNFIDTGYMQMHIHVHYTCICEIYGTCMQVDNELKPKIFYTYLYAITLLLATSEIFPPLLIGKKKFNTL